MLALTHHFIVQWAYWSVVKGDHGLPTRRSESPDFKRYHRDKWFGEYAVLGDDIVIADGRVAREYRRIMVTLGVGIGLEKSLVSRNGTLEFAKRFYYKGEDCSPLPYKEYMSARGSLSALTEFGEKYSLRLAVMLKILGYGYRVTGSMHKLFRLMPRKPRNLVIYALHPADRPWDSWWLNMVSLVKSRPLSAPRVWNEYIGLMQTRCNELLKLKAEKYNSILASISRLDALSQNVAGRKAISVMKFPDGSTALGSTGSPFVLMPAPLAEFGTWSRLSEVIYDPTFEASYLAEFSPLLIRKVGASLYSELLRNFRGDFLSLQRELKTAESTVARLQSPEMESVVGSVDRDFWGKFYEEFEQKLTLLTLPGPDRKIERVLRSRPGRVVKLWLRLGSVLAPGKKV
jgi:hypothetical protein